MCHNSCILFGTKNLSEYEIKGKRVIEVGSQNVNGSLRHHIENLGCSEYIGVDIQKGVGVDIVCNAEDIVDIFGKESFDIVISTELLEHVENWKKVVGNIKNICKRGGTILLTTRSYGFPHHEYPYDHWRYEIEDIKNIFSDCTIEILEKDSEMPGVFTKIRKEYNFVERDLSEYELFEINTNRRINTSSINNMNNRKLKSLIGIPTYNGAHRIDCLLYSIFMRTDELRHTHKENSEYIIVICDDSGKIEHQEKIISVINKYRAYLPIDILINDRNIGVSASWNRLVNSYDSQYIILINDDIIVEKDWLKNMIYFLDNNHNTGSVFYNFVPIREDDVYQLFYRIDSENSEIYNLNYKSTSPIRCMTHVGCFFGFRRDMYNMVGGFDENYFALFEETDFCTTLAYYGYPSYILRYPKSWHIQSATFRSSPEFNYSDIFQKSGQYYHKKWIGNPERLYMSNIPFQKIKWLYNDTAYEDIITGSYGYHVQ